MKRALVSGGTRGIGLAVCKLLIKDGYAVTALYSKGEGLEEAKKQLPEVEFLQADVSDENAVKAVFEKIPRLDLLVNNAGVSLYKQVQDTTLSDYRRVMDINIGGAFLCVKYAVKKMLENGGAIVNISSVWGQAGGSCESVYSASKGAVDGFTKALAKELAPSGITVNCVSPGVIDTRMNAHLKKEDRAALCEEIPLGRFGTPEEVAEAVLFLAKAKYITGQILAVNGGFYI
ncbi:MAG: SDR family oxidoreductase [Clostridia bacterium]|nr:SDR family oxidoreductase [Clostridia bacterium]